MDKKKIAIAAAASSLVTVSLATTPVHADENLEVSTNLIKDTIKPRLMDKAFQEKQNQISQKNKLNQIKAEQKRMDAVEKARIAQAKKQLQQRLAAKKQNNSTTTNKTTKATDKGQFKLSFYDPSAMGSNMGYGGVAANLGVFPRGTRLKITLSDGTVWHKVVNDTGSFAQSNPRQLDVAMPNDQVPSAGILYANVAVEG